MEDSSDRAAPGATQRRKLRQAAFVYLHLGVLYESAVFVMARRGMLGDRLGPPWFWLLAGALVVAVVFWALWSRGSVWTAASDLVARPVPTPDPDRERVLSPSRRARADDLLSRRASGRAGKTSGCWRGQAGICDQPFRAAATSASARKILKLTGPARPLYTGPSISLCDISQGALLDALFQPPASHCDR